MSDLIDRQALIKQIEIDSEDEYGYYGDTWKFMDTIKNLPSAEPEIIHCKDCRKHNQGINEAPYLTDRCPLILHRGYAHGHEFDYQYCVYAERKEN